MPPFKAPRFIAVPVALLVLSCGPASSQTLSAHGWDYDVDTLVMTSQLPDAIADYCNKRVGSYPAAYKAARVWRERNAVDMVEVTNAEVKLGPERGKALNDSMATRLPAMATAIVNQGDPRTNCEGIPSIIAEGKFDLRVYPQAYKSLVAIYTRAGKRPPEPSR